MFIIRGMRLCPHGNGLVNALVLFRVARARDHSLCKKHCGIIGPRSRDLTHSLTLNASNDHLRWTFEVLAKWNSLAAQNGSCPAPGSLETDYR